VAADLPVPFNRTDIAGCAASSLSIVSAAFASPFAFGANMILTVSLLPSVKINRPPPDLTLQGGLSAITLPCRTPRPVFLIARARVLLFPADTLPNLKDFAVDIVPDTPVPVAATRVGLAEFAVMIAIADWNGPADPGANRIVTGFT
jgi:hypothetical protein